MRRKGLKGQKDRKIPALAFAAISPNIASIIGAKGGIPRYIGTGLTFIIRNHGGDGTNGFPHENCWDDNGLYRQDVGRGIASSTFPPYGS